MSENKTYVDWVYDILKSECGSIDVIYYDYIVHLVGTYGFNALANKKLIKPGKMLGGKQLYTLIEKGEKI